MFKTQLKFALAAGFAMSLASGLSALASPAITNGSFEADTNVPPGGWNLISGGDTVMNFGSPFGNNFLEVGGFGGAVQNSIDQTVSGFTPGNTYTLQFSIASQWANGTPGGGSGAEVEVSFPSGSSTGAALFQAPDQANFSLWSTFNYNFVATAGSVDIQFQQITHNFDDVGLDNISLSDAAAPEPASLSMLGIAAVSLITRRRRARP